MLLLNSRIRSTLRLRFSGVLELWFWLISLIRSLFWSRMLCTCRKLPKTLPSTWLLLPITDKVSLSIISFSLSPNALRSSLFYSSPHRYPSARQPFSSSARSTAVEHVVLFKFRDSADQSKIDAVMSGVRSLISLDVVAYLAAGPVLRHRSAAAGFTHLLHGRYRSKDDLAVYSAHPAHVAVVKKLGLPILEDILAIDWVADLDGPMMPPPGSAMRLILAKPKQGAESELKEMLAKAKASTSALTVGSQVSFGENFSPARAKGYGVGLLAVFPGLEELDAMDAREKNMVDSVEEKVKPLLESSIVLDFVVPQPSTDDL